MDKKNTETNRENGAETGVNGQGGTISRLSVNAAKMAVILAILGIIAVTVAAAVCQ